MPSIEKKNLQRYRSMSYFINASIEIIIEEGLSNLSIRKAAVRAGYNSATLYHYFSSFEELCIFASMNFVDEYAKDLPKYLKQTDRPLYKYFRIWECFCLHSFLHPDEFWLLFFKNSASSEDFTHYFKEYYAIFPENWSEETKEYEAMLTSGSLYDREYILMTKSLKQEGLIVSEEIVHKINDMNILIYRGMLSMVRENPGKIPPQDAADKTIEYMQRTLKAYGIT